MKQLIFFLLTLVYCSDFSYGQSINKHEGQIEVDRLMDSLWIHPTSFINHTDPNWVRLNEHLQDIDILQMNELIHAVFFGKNSFVLNRSHAQDGFIGTMNKNADNAKVKLFHKKIRAGFRNSTLYPTHKVVLVEGDSWVEYPVVLKVITDFLEERPNLAIYSQAKGSDWFSNMISSLQYEYDYVKTKPDVFIISGGGNDLVGDYRLSNFILLNPFSADEPFLKNYRNYVLLRMLNKPVSICNSETCNYDKDMLLDSVSLDKAKVDTALLNQIVTGRRFLNQNFYRFMATLKLEYKMLFESLRKVDPDRFESVKIITQGYDYAIPNYERGGGLARFMDNGEYLKEPMMMSGINDPYLQQSIMKTIVFEMNEMMIELGKEYDNIYHVDARGITAYYGKYKGKKSGYYWFDELHPKSEIFGIIANAYSEIIDDKIPANQHVVNVISSFSQKNK
jgi:hypothetical protein